MLLGRVGRWLQAAIQCQQAASSVECEYRHSLGTHACRVPLAGHFYWNSVASYKQFYLWHTPNLLSHLLDGNKKIPKWNVLHGVKICSSLRCWTYNIPSTWFRVEMNRWRVHWLHFLSILHCSKPYLMSSPSPGFYHKCLRHQHWIKLQKVYVERR